MAAKQIGSFTNGRWADKRYAAECERRRKQLINFMAAQDYSTYDAAVVFGVSQSYICHLTCGRKPVGYRAAAKLMARSGVTNLFTE